MQAGLQTLSVIYDVFLSSDTRYDTGLQSTLDVVNEPTNV